MARLVPLRVMPKRRQLGVFKGRLNIPDNFDELLPDDILTLFEAY